MSQPYAYHIERFEGDKLVNSEIVRTLPHGTVMEYLQSKFRLVVTELDARKPCTSELMALLNDAETVLNSAWLNEGDDNARDVRDRIRQVLIERGAAPIASTNDTPLIEVGQIWRVKVRGGTIESEVVAVAIRGELIRVNDYPTTSLARWHRIEDLEFLGLVGSVQ